MKQLTITLYIDPGAAVRAGKSQMGEVSRTISDAELQSLTADQRETLAKHVSREETYRGYYGQSVGPNWGASLTKGQVVSDVSIETIASLLDRRKAAVEDGHRAIQQKKEEKSRKCGAKIDEAIEAFRGGATSTVKLDQHGNPSNFASFFELEAPNLPYVDVAYATDEDRARYKAVEAEAEAARYKAVEAAQPEVRARVQALELEKAKEKEAYEALYSRLPEPVRERDQAGFASEAEVKEAIRWILRRDAALTTVEGYKAKETLKHLTDAEYKNYKEVEQRAPEGATLEPLKVADCWYRQATDEDDPDDIDSDGDVWDPQNERRLVRIEWTVAGIDVWATERLD